MKALEVEVKAEQSPHDTPQSSSPPQQQQQLRQQQQPHPPPPPVPYPPLPDYTSPPTETALLATPPAYRSDAVIAHARALAAAGACRAEPGRPGSEYHCQMVFDVPLSSSSSSSSSSSLDRSSSSNHHQSTSLLGIIYYGGALIDPRAYAPTAQQLVQRYGVPVVVPIFAADLAFQTGQCQTHRLALAQAALPHVQKWIVVGHSFGGIAAMTDVYSLLQQEQVEQQENEQQENQPTTSTTSSVSFDHIGGLVMIASYIRHDIGCGTIDFSKTQLPMAMVTASLDTRVNQTRWEWGLPYLSPQTYFVDILGGNHVQFASYDDTHRATLLQQTPDPPATISPAAQLESTLAAIYNVAARAGVPLPERPVQTVATATAPDNNIDNINNDKQEQVAVVADSRTSIDNGNQRMHRPHPNQTSSTAFTITTTTGGNYPPQQHRSHYWHLHHPNQKKMMAKSSSSWNLMFLNGYDGHVPFKQVLLNAPNRHAAAAIVATVMMMMMLAVVWVQRRRHRRQQPRSSSSSFQ